MEEKVTKDATYINEYFKVRNNKKYLSYPVEIILELIKYARNRFSEEFRKYLCKMIIPRSMDLLGGGIQLLLQS